MKTNLFVPCLVALCLLLATMLGSCSSRPQTAADESATAETAAGEEMTPAGSGSAGDPVKEPGRRDGIRTDTASRQETTLPAGTEIAVRTTAGISTKSNQPGQEFSAVLEQPIVENDWVIAKKGGLVEGIITECDPGGRVQGVAQLGVTLRQLTLADGRTVGIQTSSIRRQARSTKAKDAQKIGIGAGIGAAVGAIAGGGKGAAIGAAVGGGGGTGVVLATHGEPATIASESKLTFKLTEPVTIIRQ
jgi:hypothetical protein